MIRQERRPRLIGAGGLALFAAVILIALVVVFPRREAFTEATLSGSPDDVSLGYLESARELAPDDAVARLAVSRHLLALGRRNAALANLEPLLSPGHPSAAEARELAFEIQWLSYNALEDGDPRRPLEAARLLESIEWFVERGDAPVAADAAARRCLAIGRPDLAARLFESLASREPERRAELLAAASRWRAAAGEPGRAGRLALDASRAEVDDARALGLALNGVGLLVGADEGDLALVEADRLLGRFPRASELLEIAVTTARARGEVELAARYGRRLVALAPSDVTILERQLELELAANESAHATRVAHALVALAPSDPAHRLELARLAEWTDAPRVALDEWVWLAEHFAREAWLEHARRLAESLYEYEIAAHLLELRVARAPHSPQALADLVAALVRVGRVEDARLHLERARARGPADRATLDELVRLSDGPTRRDEAAALVAEKGRLLGPRLADVIAHAERLWSMDAPERALEALSQYRGLVGPASTAFWELQAELAWSLEWDREALEAYRTLWRTARRDPLTAQRLLVLTRALELHRETLDVAVEAWELFRRPDDLLLAMEMSMTLGLPEQTAELVARAAASEHLFESSEFYLILRADLAVREHRVEEALAFYHKALALNPNARYARSGLLWLLIDERRTDELAASLRRWRAVAPSDPTLWSAYAAGHHLLGAMDEAVAWYARKARDETENALWLLSFADALDDTARHNSALRLRRHVLRTIEPQAIRALARLQEESVEPASTQARERRELLFARAVLARELEGGASGARWFDNVAAAVRDEPYLSRFAVSWHLAQGELDRATWWTLERRLDPAEQPAWQRLALALRGNDRAVIQDVMESAALELSALERVRALRALGREDDAMDEITRSLPGERDPDFTTLLREFLDLRAAAPTFGSFEQRAQDLDGLELAETRLRAAVSGDNATLSLTPSARQFDANRSDLRLDGRESELDLALGLAVRRSRWDLALAAGVSDQEADTIGRLELDGSRRLSSRLELRLEAGVNERAADSPALIVAGARHRLGAGIHADITQREYASARAAVQRFHARTGGEIARGYDLGIEIGHRALLEAPSWDLHATASWSENDLVGSLPRALADVVGAGTTAESVLPERFGTAGVGTRLAAGGPEANALLAGPLSYRLELWGGWMWPSDRIVWRAEAGAGVPLFGKDELAVSAFWIDSQAGLEGQESRGIALTYTWHF